MSEELLPCPFCGSDDVEERKAGAAVVGTVHWIVCNECGAGSGEASTAAEAQETWNRRAEPKVKAVDRFGKEVHAGDWIEYDGESYEVRAISRSDAFAEIASGSFVNTSRHTRCPLGVDGKPLLIGETVYDEGGVEYTVRGYDDGEVRVRDEDSNTRCWIEPCTLTHEAPDSWEKLEEDLMLISGEYCEKRGLEVDDFPLRTRSHDVVARAKKLAGIEGGDE